MSNKPNNWEEAAKENAEKYIACVAKGQIYDSTGLIDSGALLSSMRSVLDYTFINCDILEYGCGNGRMTKFLRPYFKKYYCVDISETMLTLLRENAKETTTIKVEGKDLPLKEDSIDLIFSFTVLMHNEKETVTNIVSELYRVLKVVGYAFIQLPCYPNSREIQNCTDVAIWDFQEICELFKDFETINIEAEENALTHTISEKHFKYHILRKK
jgi:SAM-dependent methyltransferase